MLSFDFIVVYANVHYLHLKSRKTTSSKNTQIIKIFDRLTRHQTELNLTYFQVGI